MNILQWLNDPSANDSFIICNEEVTLKNHTAETGNGTFRTGLFVFENNPIIRAIGYRTWNTVSVENVGRLAYYDDMIVVWEPSANHIFQTLTFGSLIAGPYECVYTAMSFTLPSRLMLRADNFSDTNWHTAKNWLFDQGIEIHTDIRHNANLDLFTPNMTCDPIKHMELLMQISE